MRYGALEIFIILIFILVQFEIGKRSRYTIPKQVLLPYQNHNDRETKGQSNFCLLACNNNDDNNNNNNSTFI